MDRVLKAWHATLVRRWHTQPELVHTHDPDGHHQHRCTILLLCFWPDSSRDSIIDTLTHDQGEIDAGDMAGPAKQKHPTIRQLLQDVEDESIESQGLNLCDPSELEIRRRKFVDCLDSYLWMRSYKSAMALKPAWANQFEWLIKESIELGIYEEFIDFTSNVQVYYPIA